MTRGHVTLALVALVAGIVCAAISVAVSREGTASTLDAVLGMAVGWSFIVSGLIAWACRPGNAIGPLMVLAGFLHMGARFCIGSQGTVLYPAGHLFHLAFWVTVGCVLLAFPSGRLDMPSKRIVAVAAVLAPLWLSWLLLGGEGTTPAFLTLTSSVAGARAISQAQALLGLVLASLTVVVLIRRWRRASERFRFAIAPVLWAGTAGFAVLAFYLTNEQLGEPLGAQPMVLLDVVLAGVPIGFLVGLLRARLAHSAVAELVVELGGSAGPGHVRDSLARALRDASLTLAYWLPERNRYVDVDGRPVAVPTEGEARAVTVIERDGRRIGALVHDPGLVENPRLVQSVCAAAALALQNERLQAELRARLDDLQASRVRIVEAADEERRRIERNLHDGTQQRLVSISMALGLARAKLHSDPAAADSVFGEARQGLTAALEELRELSRGIHPGILTERGLAAALDELAMRATVPVEVTFSADRPLPEHVEATAYYVVSEALANIAKYARASSARVRVESDDGRLTVEVLDDGVGGANASRGSGLRGLTDRAEALGGRLSLSSPAGKGTILRAEIPCA